MYYRHHQNYDYNQNDAHRRLRHHLHRHHPYQNPSYYHQNPSYYDQNPSYHRHQNPRYYRDQNYAYHHQNPSYYHDQNYAYLHQNPSYYHCPYQNRHQNPSYDQIPHHHQRRRQQHFYDQNLAYYHHQQQHRNRFYDQNLSNNHHQQQQNHRNRFCSQNLSYYSHHQIEAPNCAASNPTRRLLVAKVKPKPKPPVVIDFPADVLILILARLPVKTLQKFRCVCKSWNSLIQQDHHFLSLHQLHLNDKKRPPPLITLNCSFRTPDSEGLDFVLNYSSSSSDTTPYKFNFTRFQQDPPYFITNSCNGLLGVYSSHNSFFIVNPTIRKLRPLPTTGATPGSLAQAALGFDASTGVHKVLRMFDREYEGFMPVRFGCEVYYLGGSGGWKLIDDPPVLPSCVSLPVVVDGAMIWASETVLCKKHLEVVALSFDLREEKFSVIMHPEGSSRSTTHPISHVFASEGCLCVADENTIPVTSAHVNIWLLMKDDKKNSSKWVKQYVIDLTYVLKRIGLFCTAQPLTTDHNGRIVISWGQGRKDYYDPRTGSFDKHELDARVDVEHVTPYTESMVWPWPRLSGAQ
ncbi:F-box protein-like [Iris pallida]|uniref:F-box protein-like n=2 Tax=Iris pallida TaxID=29817 RepID=A0AAX6F4M2_IRIPA|nr:F-box protein-like [Iris pallida]